MNNKHSKSDAPQFPWYGLPSIFEFIKSNIDENGFLKKSAHRLPDRLRKKNADEILISSGAKAGIEKHHFSNKEDENETLDKLCDSFISLLKSISTTDSIDSKVELYQVLVSRKLENSFHKIFNNIDEKEIPASKYLKDYANWLAFESPESETVEFGIFLLGWTGHEDCVENLITLGTYEGFTSLAANSIKINSKNPKRDLLRLGKVSQGWGRVSMDRILIDFQDAEINKWLIKYDNSKDIIAHYYTVFMIAVEADLKGHLANPNIEREVLKGAGSLVKALVYPEVTSGLEEYEDGAEMAVLYVKRLQHRREDYLHIIGLNALKEFVLNEKKNWGELEKIGWTKELKANLLKNIEEVLTDSLWKQLVLGNRYVEDNYEFSLIDHAAAILEIDIWDAHEHRFVQNPVHSWHWSRLAQSSRDNPNRIDKIIELALKFLPFEQLRIPPKVEEKGFGVFFGKSRRSYNCLKYLLQELPHFPHKGFELIKEGLKSPISHSRYLAIKSLSEWDKEFLPKEAKFLVLEMEQNEEDKEIKEDIRALKEAKWN